MPILQKPRFQSTRLVIKTLCSRDTAGVEAEPRSFGFYFRGQTAACVSIKSHHGPEKG